MKVNKFNERVKYSEYFRVKDLIEHLKKFDPELPVGKVGHFGDLNTMDAGDFYESNAHYDPKGNSYQGWRQLSQYPYEKVLNVSSPDIGPEPD